MSKQSQLSIDDILSSVNGVETDLSISNNETSEVQSIDDILSGFQPASTPSPETEKDEAGFAQFSGKKDMPNAVSTADDAPPSPDFREARMSLDKAQRELAKDKQIAAATAPQTPEVSPTGFKMPKVDLSATDKTTTEDLAATSPIVKKQVESLLAPEQPSIIEADFRDFTTVLPYTAEDGSVRNYEGQQLDKATIRSFFTKDKDGAYQLPNGKAIYSDALFEKFVDEYYKRYNHPILMQDENYRKDYILRNYGKTEEKFIADATSAMNAQLDRIEEAYEQTRPKIESTKVYPYVTNDEPRAASKSLRDLRKKINSISKDNFWSGFNESFDVDDILALGLPSLGTAVNQLSALNKYVNGEELTPEENLYVQLNMLSQQIDQFRGEYRNDNGLSMNRVGNIVGFMPQFATQIGVTSKIIPQVGAKAVKDITLKAVADTMKKSASEGLKMGLKKIGTSMLNDAIATPFMTMTHKAYADRRLGHYNWEGENLVKENTPWAVDYLKALGETFVERHSEQIGEWVTGGLLYGGKRLAQSKLLDNAFGRGVNRMLNYKLPPMLEQARKNLRVSGYIGEVASEIYNNVINPAFTGETDSWKELLSGRYYWDLLTSIAISTGSFYSLGVPDYIRQGRSIKQLDNSRAKVFANISSQPLKDVLQSAFASDNLEVAVGDLSAVDWKNISAQDAKAASEYIFDTINSKLLQAEAVEAERLQAFMPIVEGVTSSLYSGGSVMAPQMGTQLQTAELKDGSTAFIIWGDVQDADTTQFVVKAADGKLSTINREDIAAVKSMDMSDYLAEQYSLMFSDSINKERLTNFIKDLNTAQQNNVSPEAISTIYDRSGYVLFNEGDSVTLTDGSIGVVAGYRDGKYLIAEPTNPDIVSVVGFLNILQPNVDIATAQVELVEDINNGSVEVDTTVDDSYVSEEDILRQKLESAAEQISTDDGKDIYVIRLADGREATVKQGQIVLNEDGTIDTDNSTPTIVIRDAESQAIQQIGIEEVDSVIEELNAQEAIDAVQSSIEEQIAKRDLIAEIFAQKGVVDVILTSGNAGKIVEILTDDTYTFNWIGEDKQTYSIAITLDQVAEVLPPKEEKEESAATETDNTESEAEVAEEDTFEGFNPEPINFDKVDWDNISTTDYINLSVLAYGPAETLPRTRGYYLKSKENVEKAQKRVEAQDAAIAKLKAKYADLAGPGEAVKLDKKVREAEAEKVKKIAAVTKLEQEVAKYAKTLEQLGVNIQEEVAIINDRKNLEQQKAELVEADANLDKFAEQGTSEAVNTIVNNEANRNRIYNLYVSRGVAPDQAGVTSAVLWDIVTGNVHLRWEDYKTDAGNVEKGLGSELGLANSTADKRAYKAVLDKNGMSVDSYVHSLWERMDGYSNELDDMDMKNEVLSVLQSTPNGTAALQTLYDALGMEDAAEESYSMNKAEIAQQIADIDKRIAENAVAQTEFNKKVQNKIDQLEGKNVPTIAQNSQNNNTFAENDDTDGREETNIRRDNIPSLEAGADNSSRVDTVDATEASFLEQSGDNISAGRGDIRVFEQGLGSEHSWSDADSERDIRQAVSQRLVEIAQENGLFIPLADTKTLGEKYPGRTGESTVYIDETAGKVYKVKNPYAKSALKKVAPQDAIYEHIVHNLLFPEAPYKFEGISKDVDGVRIVLSQPFIENKGRASQSQIEQALAARGLYPDGRYSYGNDYVSVTDVEGDNVILGADGTVYFIDPIIKFKKPVAEIIEKLSKQTSDSAAFMIGNFKIVAPEGTSAEKWAVWMDHLTDTIGADNVITDEEQMRQILNNLLQSGEIRTMIKTKGFYSDAERAVEEIKQEKATPQQWLAMLQKNGGLKAGEDKWIGLSDWLKASEKKTLTKQEVLDYIRANKIQIEEVEYADTDITDITDITDTSEFQALKDEFEDIHSRITAEEWRKADKYSDSLIEKYGFQNNTIDMEALSDGERDTLTRLQITDSEAADLAWVEMFDKYGDDFEIAFDTFGGVLSIKDEDAARSFLGISNSTKPINSIRKRYTTDGLDNLREIALTVPTIDSWQEGDKVHFGDAGEGRAIAWIRFGETTVPREVEVVREVELEAPFKAYNGHDIYRVKDTNGKHFIIYGKLKNGQMMYVPQINGKYIGETVETAAFDTLEQAQEALVAYYKAHPIRKTINERILVIDEIQSNRHQEGRKLGYESKEDKAALDAIIAAREELGKEQRDFEYRTGQAWQRWQNGEISEQEYNEMWNTQFDAENKALRAKQEAIDAQLSEYKKNKKPGVIPAAPFESNWAELAFKRMLHYAAENGFDKVAWTTGAQQAERYSLNNYFSSVSRWDINTDDMPGRYYTLNGSTKIGINVNEDGQIISASLDELVGKPLSDVVGKEVASKMMEMEDRSSLEDIEFQIGGEGMKAFYDKMLVSFMNKYGKKWDARVGEVTMPELDENNTMHAVDVTNAMRISVLEGQPMFRAMMTSKGEVYGFTYNRKIYIDPKILNMEVPIHEYTELWCEAIEEQNPELWSKGKKLLKQTNIWQQVNSDPNYRDLPEDLRASETLSRIVAAEAAKKIEEIEDSKTLIAQLRAWLRKFWNTLKATFSQWTKEDISKLTLREFKAMPFRDYIEKIDPRKYLVKNSKITAASIDAEYMDAVRNGDIERAKELVRQYAETRGYTTSQDFRDGHGAPTATVEKKDFTNAELINQQSMDDSLDINLFSLPQGENLAPNDFWSPQGPRWYMYNDDAGMQAYAAISSAIRAINYQLREYGEVRNIPSVKVYRAVPNSIEATVLQNGDWVTPSKLYADRHGKARFGFDEYKIIEQEVPATELWWDGNDAREWGYDNGNVEATANTPNNVKLLDPITYDDEGNIIPLSSRFDKSVADPRFMFVGEKGAAAMDAAEEATIRLDNLAVAREMEKKFADNNNLEAVNEQFNEGLKTITEDNARSRIFDLGAPSPILLATGIEDKPIRLYGAKLLSKAKKHNYELSDLKDFPKYVASPIAVFKGAYDGAFAVLTELVVDNKNMLATLSVGKGGHDVDFNIVTSVYDKRGESIVRWINDNKLLYVNKEKALNYFSDSAPIAEAQNNQELVSTTKIIQNFENPTITPQNIAKKIKLATGWERGADGKWRYEVPDDYNLDDFENRIRERLAEDERSEKEKSTWGIVYNDNLGTLIDAYPDFNVDIIVYVGNQYNNTGSYEEGIEGDESYFGRPPQIEIKAKTVEDVKEILVHEIQHAIQEIEGFAQGGNSFGLNTRLETELNRLTNEINTLRAAGKNDEADAIIKSNKGLVEAVINNDRDEFGNYRKLAGEVEARNASARMNMTPEQRRESLASETQDVATEDQIFLYNNMGVAQSVESTPQQTTEEVKSTKSRVKSSQDVTVDEDSPEVSQEEAEKLSKTKAKEREELLNRIEEFSTRLEKTDSNFDKVLLDIYKFMTSRKTLDALSYGLSDKGNESITRGILSAVRQAYRYKTLNGAKKAVERELLSLKGALLRKLSREHLKEIINILNTGVYGYTPQGVKLGKRIDELTRQAFERLRLAMAWEDDTVEFTATGRRKPKLWKLQGLKGEDISTTFRLRVKGSDPSAKVMAEINELIAQAPDGEESPFKDKTNILYAIKDIMDQYDSALEDNSLIGQIGTEISDLNKEISNLYQELRQYERGSNEHNNIRGQIRRAKNSIDDLKAKRIKVRSRYATRLETVISLMNDFVKGGVAAHQSAEAEKREAELEWRRGIFRSIRPSGTYVLAHPDLNAEGKRKSNTKRWLRGLTYENQFIATFEQISRDLDINSIPGQYNRDGIYYQMILSNAGLMERYDWLYRTSREISEQLEQASAEYNSSKYNKLAKFAQKRIEEISIPYVDEKKDANGKVMYTIEQIIHPTIAEMLYIRATVRQPNGYDGYLAWKIPVEAIDKTISYVEEKYPALCAFADWVVRVLLPMLYEIQDAIYFRRYGTHLPKSEFYFPFVRDSRSVGSDAEIGEDFVSLPSSTIGNTIERVKTRAKMDLSADFFSVLQKHIKETLDWCAFSELTDKMNSLLTSKNFKNLLTERNVDWKKFKEMYEIAIGMGKINSVDNNAMTKALNTLSKGIVAGNMAFNLNAALKQVISMTATLGYSANPKFFTLWAKNHFVPGIVELGISKVIQKIKDGSLNPTEAIDIKMWMENWRWAIDNVPTLRERWEGRALGFEQLKAHGIENWDKLPAKLIEWGLTPNAFMDMITCSNGAKAIYEYEYPRGLKRGLSAEEAKRDACVKAAVYINRTQQSNLDGFLSSFQSGGSWQRILGSSINAYQNSSMAFARNEFDAVRHLIRMCNKNVRKKMIARQTDYYKSIGIDDTQATNLAHRDFAESVGQQVVGVGHNAILNNLIWRVATPLSALVAAVVSWIFSGFDDDELDKFIKNEELREQWADAISIESLAWQWPFAYNHPISKQILEYISMRKQGNTYTTLFQSPAVQDLQKLINAITTQWIGVTNEQTGEKTITEPLKYDQTVGYIVSCILIKIGLGINVDIAARLTEGIKGMIEDGVDTEDIMNILNSPRALTRAIAGEPREGESQKEYLDRMSFVYRMIGAGSGDYDPKWQKERIQEYIRNNERPLYEAMGIDPLEVTKFEAHRKAIDKSLLLQRSGNKAKVKDKKVEEYKALSARGKEYQSQMFTLSVQIKALDQRLDTMIEFDSERSELLRQKYNLEKELYDKWQNFIKL